MSRTVWLLRAAAPLLAGLAALAVLWLGLGFMRDPRAPAGLFTNVYDLFGMTGAADAIRARGLEPVWAKIVTAVVALGVGVGGVWLLFVAMIGAVERIGGRLGRRLAPFAFVGPAIVMLGFFLVYPSVSTIVASLTEDGGAAANFGFALADPEMWIALRNNVLWLVLGTGGSVLIGLLFAALVDRVKREALAKTFIFLPLAISMAGAAVIWRFVYAWQPEGETQIGLLNAVVTAAGADPVPWLQRPPLNTLLLIVVMIWLQTGFAMVVLSAALKGVSSEVIEAARMDGATERQVFLRVVVPMIRPSIVTVATTIAIAILKVFDIVFVTTGGRFETEVVANRMFAEMFRFGNFGHASALAVILFVAVIPIIVVNLRNLNRQGIGP